MKRTDFNSVLSDGEMKEIVKMLDSFCEEAQQKIGDQALKKGADLIATQARLNCPVDTGTLRNSIKPRNVRFNKSGCTISIGSSKRYAAAVEYGHGFKTSDSRAAVTYLGGPNGRASGGVSKTSKGAFRWVAARPFIRTALQQQSQRVIEVVAREVKKLTEQYNAREP